MAQLKLVDVPATAPRRRLREKIQALINRVFRLEMIDGDGRCPPYLYRWTVFSLPWVPIKAYLHHFVADDWSQDMHDHPKRFISIGLKGGYIEQTPAPLGLAVIAQAVAPAKRSLQLGHYQYFKAPWIRSFPATHVHRVIVPKDEDCWTLCVVLRAVRPWGFWPNGK